MPQSPPGLTSKRIFAKGQFSVSLGEFFVSAGPRWNVFALAYERKKLPSPGVQNYAYENLGLVEFSPIGPSTRNRKQFKAFQPQPLFSQLGLPLSGLGGVMNGQMIMQPLLNPSSQASQDLSTDQPLY